MNGTTIPSTPVVGHYNRHPFAGVPVDIKSLPTFHRHTNLRRLVYVACPYSHPQWRVRHERFLLVSQFCGKLHKTERMVFSPISHSHPMTVEIPDMPINFEYYREFNEFMLSLSKKLIVLTLPGWKESKGVKSEIAYAQKEGIQIEYASP